MKHSITHFLIILLLAAGFFAFSSKKEPKELPKEFKDLRAVSFVPAGVYDGDSMPSFFMFTHEVTNLDYNEFLYAIKIKGDKEELAQAAMDSAAWFTVELSGADTYADSYDRKANYPVVNVSRKAANMYCKWLSEIWNSQQDAYEATFRLPSRDEWTYAASAGKGAKLSPYPWNGPYVRNKLGEFLAQHQAIGLPHGPVEVGSFPPNDFGLFDMSGNVAEMVADGNITKGGSWNSTMDKLQLDSEETMERSPYVGFRPILNLRKK